MKNSAWYQKLWLKKLDKLPVKDADLGWKGMRALLDEQMPVSGNPAGRLNYSPGTKLVKILISYLLPVAVVIVASILLYYRLPVFHQSKIHKNKSTPRHVDSTIKINQVNTGNLARQNIVDPDNKTAASKIKSTDKLTAVESRTRNSQPGYHVSKQVGTVDASINKKSVVYSNKENLGKPHEKTKKTKNAEDAAFRSSNNAIAANKRKKAAQYAGQSSQQKAGNNLAVDKQSLANGIIAKRHNNNGNNFVMRNQNKGTNAGIKEGMLPVDDKDNRLESTSTSGILKDKILEPASSSQDNNSPYPEKTSTNNTAAKVIRSHIDTNKAPDSSKARTVKNKSVNYKKRQEIITPRYNYGLESGLSAGGSNSSSFYLGGFGTYAIKPRLLINVGIRINSYRTISGSFTHVSYHGQDSLPPFAVVDSRKLLVADIPVTMEYKLFNGLSIKAGVLIILPVKQSGITTKLAPITYPRDTLYNTHEINTALNSTTMNRVNLGFTGEISLHIKKFDINGGYQVLKPYKISNALGNYSKTYQTFQLGIGWRFR